MNAARMRGCPFLLTSVKIFHRPCALPGAQGWYGAHARVWRSNSARMRKTSVVGRLYVNAGMNTRGNEYQ